MANSFNVPFDFNPTSVSVKTSSYTVPAGFYAYVINASDDDFTIDGIAAFENPDSYYDSMPANYTYYYYTITQPGSFTIAHYYNKLGGTNTTDIAPDGTNYYNLQSHTGAGTATMVTNVFLNKGAVIRWRKDQYLSSAGLTGCRESIVSGGFWVPTGTVLNGDRYTVALFNEIS